MEILPARTKKEIDGLSIQIVLDAHDTRDQLPATAGRWKNVNFLAILVGSL
jgi:hypothetical protein